MSASPALIAAWARSAVVPHGGAFRLLMAHDIAAPVVQSLLARAGVKPQAVDALVVGNALGAGGNPARMVSLAAGLPERCAALSVDTQCCSGLDAVRMGVALIESGQASVVIAGGVEAWSRAPIRMARPRHAGEDAQAYERPAFAPNPTQDPDLLLSAARYAASCGFTRTEQDAYAVLSHQRAVTYREQVSQEIVAVNGVPHDVYPRPLTPERAARMPVAAHTDGQNSGEPGTHAPSPAQGQDCSISRLGVSAKADGAAFVLLLSASACDRLGAQAHARWVSSASIGCAPGTQPLRYTWVATVLGNRTTSGDGEGVPAGDAV